MTSVVGFFIYIIMQTKSNHWPWVISTNFSEGLPYAAVTTLSVVMLADMGLGNAEVAAYTSLLAMPWSLKALWSPVVEIWRGKRWWMWMMQVILACCFVGVAFGLLTASAQGVGLWLSWVLTFFTIGAFTSATYDIACDGFYMQVLDTDEQSFFVGIRSTAYRLSMIFASGLLTSLVGLLARHTGGDLQSAWVQVMIGVSLLMLCFAIAHAWLLPRPDKRAYPQSIQAQPNVVPTSASGAFLSTLSTFFQKPGLWFILLFLLFYRLGEALLSKMTILFLKAPVDAGGLGLDNTEYGLIYGTIGVGALTIGGILGGMLVSKYGLKKCVVPLALALNVPDLLYVWLSVSQPESRWLIGSCVGIEQFGYGLGFTAYMVFMLQSAKGPYQTAHYAIITALMAIGMNIPPMLSGWLQEFLGYTDFFWVVIACTIPGILLSVWLTFKSQK